MPTFDIIHVSRRQMNSSLLMLCLQLAVVCAMELPPIYWNSSNPMFKASSNDLVVEVNIGDTLDFICPYHSSARSQHHLHDYFSVHQVSQMEYDNCQLFDNSSTASIISCTNPRQKRRFTIWFDEFAAIPNVPEFVGGQTYYFITTAASDGDQVRQSSRGGACYHRNMKLQVHVCCAKHRQSDPPHHHHVTKHKKPSVKSLSHDSDKSGSGSGMKSRAQHTLSTPSQETAGDTWADKSVHRQRDYHGSRLHGHNKHQPQHNQHLTRISLVDDTARLSDGRADESTVERPTSSKHRAANDAADHCTSCTSTLLLTCVTLVCTVFVNHLHF